MLAGIIQRPGYFNPYRHPERVRDRRNVVLGSDAPERPHHRSRIRRRPPSRRLNLAKGAASRLDAPYFVDMVNDDLQSKFQDFDFQANSFRVYTTLDLDLQRAAAEAVRAGMQGVDELIASRSGSRAKLPRRRSAR